MANLTHYVKQVGNQGTATAYSTTSSTGAELTDFTVPWSDLTTAGFAAGDDVAVLVFCSLGANTTSNGGAFQVGFGSTWAGRSDAADSYARVEPPVTSVPGIQYRWLDRRTLVNNENIYFTGWFPGGGQTAYYNYFRCVVLKLGDLTSSDFAYAEATHSGNAPSSFDTSGASISTPAAGDWLFFAVTRWLMDSSTANNSFVMAINDGTSDIAQQDYEGEDANNDEACVGTMAYKASFGSGVTVRVRYLANAVHDCVRTAIFGLRLDAFEDHWGTRTTNTVTHSVAGTYSTFASNSSYSKSSTGPFITFGSAIQTFSALDNRPAAKTQIAGSDWPSTDATYALEMENYSGSGRKMGPTTIGYASSLSSGTKNITWITSEIFNVTGSPACTEQNVAAFSLTLASAADTGLSQPYEPTRRKVTPQQFRNGLVVAQIVPTATAEEDDQGLSQPYPQAIAPVSLLTHIARPVNTLVDHIPPVVTEDGTWRRPVAPIWGHKPRRAPTAVSVPSAAAFEDEDGTGQPYEPTRRKVTPPPLFKGGVIVQQSVPTGTAAEDDEGLAQPYDQHAHIPRLTDAPAFRPWSWIGDAHVDPPAPPPPGGSVLYADSGTVSDVPGDTDLSPTAPAAVNVGDILVCVIGHNSNATQLTATYTPPTGWTLANSITQGNTRQFVYQKDAVDGTEDGASYTWTVSGGAAAASHNAFIHRFTGGTGSLKAFSSAQATNITPADADVTTTVANDLAINFTIQAAQLLGAEFSGEVGGDWALVHSYDVGPPRMMLHTAQMPSVGTIGGGTTSIGGSTAWISMGYAIEAAPSADGVRQEAVARPRWAPLKAPPVAARARSDHASIVPVDDGTWMRPTLSPPRQAWFRPRPMPAWDTLVDAPGTGGNIPVNEGNGGYDRQAGDVALTVPIPTCNAGDLLYLQFGHLNSPTQASATYSVSAGWEQRYVDQANSTRQWIYRRVADGTEGGSFVTITATGGVAGGAHQGVVHRFSGAAPAVEIGPAVSLGGATDPVTVFDAGITTTADNCLALQFGFFSASQTPSNFAGETGGDWALVSQTPNALSARPWLQTASKPTIGTIDGGTFQRSSTGAWIVRGFALVYEDAGSLGSDATRPPPPHFQRTQRLIRHLHTEGPPEDAAPHTGYQFTPRRFYPIPPIIRPRYGRNGTLVEPVAPPAEDPLPFLPHTARPVSRVFYRVIRGRKPDGVLLDDEVSRIDAFVVHPPIQSFVVSHRIIRPKVVTDGWLGEDDEVAEPGDSWPVIPRFRSSYRIIRPRSGHSAVESTAEIDLILSVVLDDAELDAVVAVEARKAMIAESLLTEKAKGVRRTRMGYRAPKRHF